MVTKLDCLVDKLNKVVIVPHGALQSLPVEEIKEMGFTICEAPNFKGITTKFFKKNKNRKKKEKTNYKK
ncbi:hypothetical protein [Cetobacterium sp.]|uniref:hypothetical protein n=1 Tax=Cetobacterium sp. TaxID=2071632 RepID=UPI003F380646